MIGLINNHSSPEYKSLILNIEEVGGSRRQKDEEIIENKTLQSRGNAELELTNNLSQVKEIIMTTILTNEIQNVSKEGTITTILINEQHTLLPDQEKLLPEKYQTKSISKDGWSKKEMDLVMTSLRGDIIFISPVPYMINELAFSAGANWVADTCHIEYPFAERGEYRVESVKVMCNDHREKKELPNGKIISVTAKEGWYLA